jgi:hypothetical protein
MERHRIDLFFGNGGRYTINELRAAMLDLLETDISLMHKEARQGVLVAWTAVSRNTLKGVNG